MAVGERSSRRITVEARAFRWRCEFRQPAEQFWQSYDRPLTSGPLHRQ